MKVNFPQIITIPNQLLRQPNKPITHIDKKTKLLLSDLEKSLIASGGVGLAAPQIGANYRVFATNLTQVLPGFPKKQNPIRFFINPKIIETAPRKEFIKEKDGNYTLEGCLSLPYLYSPVPRYPWIFLEFQEIDPETQTLITTREKFTDFYARNIQHENDHLEGILFTDYLRHKDIILYRGNSRNDDLEEVDDLSFIYAI